MASKRTKELRNLTKDELTTKSRELEKQLFEERMKKMAGTLADSASLWRIRKDVARVKTLQGQMAAGGQAGKK
jgi:large subunit ribosomal protein L29